MYLGFETSSEDNTYTIQLFPAFVLLRTMEMEVSYI